MAKKITKSIKKMIKTYEKDSKTENKIWGSIERTHKEDETILSSLKGLFARKPRKSAAKNQHKSKR